MSGVGMIAGKGVFRRPGFAQRVGAFHRWTSGSKQFMRRSTPVTCCAYIASRCEGVGYSAPPRFALCVSHS